MRAPQPTTQGVLEALRTTGPLWTTLHDLRAAVMGGRGDTQVALVALVRRLEVTGQVETMGGIGNDAPGKVWETFAARCRQ